MLDLYIKCIENQTIKNLKIVIVISFEEVFNLIYPLLLAHLRRSSCGLLTTRSLSKMAPSRLEINFHRLLARCEAMAKDYHDKKEGLSWRLEKYVYALQSQASDLAKSPSKPNPDTMSGYCKRVDFLRGLVETEKMKSPIKKAVVSQQLVRSTSYTMPLSGTDRQPATNVQELHLKTKSRLQKEMRDELLGTGKSTDSQGIRNRRTGDDESKLKEESIDAVLQYHQNMQEKIADDMIMMAQSMKHTSLVARNIIQKDNKSLEASTRLADSNFSKLKHESDRLEEIANRRCSLWMWIVLAMVMTVFIMMILFIRMFPKLPPRT